MVDRWVGTIKFTANDGSESPKYGSDYNISNSYQLRQNTSLASVTVLYGDSCLIGLKFAYRDKSADTI